MTHRCRGTGCTEANSRYEAHRSRQRLYGIEADFVDAAPVREHINALRQSGLGLRRIAALSGVSRSTLSELYAERPGRNTKQRVRSSIARKLLAVDSGQDSLAAAAPVDATGTHRRIQALVALGYSYTRLGAGLGLSGGNVAAMLQRQSVQARTARKVSDLYESYWDRPIAGAEGSRSRNLAQRKGWLPPMAWDDETIDDPDFEPAAAEPPQGSKVEAKRRAFLEEIEHLAGFSLPLGEVSRHLGITADAVEKQLVRLGRQDLLKRMSLNGKRAA